MTTEEFDQLFRKEYARLYRLAFTMLRDPEESKDIVSQVFADLYARLSSFDAQNPAAFLSIAVRNRCLDFIDHQKVEEKFRRNYPLERKLLTETDQVRESRLQQVMAFINQELTPQTRRIMLLRYDEGLSYAEVAQQLGISLAAVNKHVSQAFKALRSKFNPSK